MRRCQILLASASGLSPPKIAANLGCASQTVRNAIRAFNHRGMDALTPGSSTPKRVHSAFDAESAERLRGMLHRSPREFGYECSLCGFFGDGRRCRLEVGEQTPGAVALVLVLLALDGPGASKRRMEALERMSATLSRLLGIRWLRAKQVDHLSRPPVPKKKRLASLSDRLM